MNDWWGAPMARSPDARGDAGPTGEVHSLERGALAGGDGSDGGAIRGSDTPANSVIFGRVSFTIVGEPASKSNSRQLVTFGRGEKARPALIKSEKAREYEKTAALQIPGWARVMFAGPVRVTMTIFYASERPDLDESLVLHALQARH